MALKPVTQKQFLVILDKLTDTYWTKATAPKETREVVEYNDGQTGNIRKALGFLNRDNITLSKPFDPAADKALMAWYENIRKNGTTAEGFTVTITPVNNDMAGTTISGVTITLTGCQVVSFRTPEVDRAGSAIAMVELELLYDDISF